MEVIFHTTLIKYSYLPLFTIPTAWKVSKYGPEKTPYLDTFHAVSVIQILFKRIMLKTILFKEATLNINFDKNFAWISLRGKEKNINFVETNFHRFAKKTWFPRKFHVFLIRKPFFPFSQFSFNTILEIRLKFS